MANEAPALVRLRDQINVIASARSKASDGIIGDASHQATKSDHNDGNALDITLDVVNGPYLPELKAALLEDPRVTYVIFNAEIQSRIKEPGVSRPYTGVNAHKHHLHVSVDAEQRDDTTDWDLSNVGIGGPGPAGGGVAGGSTDTEPSMAGSGWVPALLITLSAVGIFWATVAGLASRDTVFGALNGQARPSQWDIADAIRHADTQGEGWTPDDFDLHFEGTLSPDELRRFDDIDAWLDGDLASEDASRLSKMGQFTVLANFRGPTWAKRAMAWLVDGIPPIVVTTAPVDGRSSNTLHTQVGDGRGRVNFAVLMGLKIPVWHAMFKEA